MSALALVGQPSTAVRLADTAVAVPALSSHVRPALVVTEYETRHLLEEVERAGVRVGGLYAAGPTGIQLWSGPFDGPNGGPGSAVLLGSVDWTFDTPVKHYATVHRTMVTAAGVSAGETTASVFARVLALGGLSPEGARLSVPIPPPRDPFRRRYS